MDILADDVGNVADLNAAASASDVSVGVYVDVRLKGSVWVLSLPSRSLLLVTRRFLEQVNVGQDRCGVEPAGDALLAVARAVRYYIPSDHACSTDDANYRVIDSNVTMAHFFFFFFVSCCTMLLISFCPLI